MKKIIFIVFVFCLCFCFNAEAKNNPKIGYVNLKVTKNPQKVYNRAKRLQRKTPDIYRFTFQQKKRNFECWIKEIKHNNRNKRNINSIY